MILRQSCWQRSGSTLARRAANSLKVRLLQCMSPRAALCGVVTLRNTTSELLQFDSKPAD